MKKHIFTIIAGCMPVGIKMLESYFKHHKELINIYCFVEDVDELKKASGYNSMGFTLHILPGSLKESFDQGHLGTAKVWARVIEANPDSYLIHIDSDVIFKKESLSLIEISGYPDIYGSRRCYQNNPGKSPVKEGIEDAVSTYFIGFNPRFITEPCIHEHEIPKGNVLETMIQGTYNPLGFPVLDFFDPVFFWMRHKGASVYYEEQDVIGGQDFLGSKKSKYPSNMHLDMGSHLAHFGGVGSGYVTQLGLDNGVFSYGSLNEYQKWSFNRWYFFEDLFNKPEYYPCPTDGVFDESGRWVSGGYNDIVWDQVKMDLQN